MPPQCDGRTAALQAAGAGSIPVGGSIGAKPHKKGRETITMKWAWKRWVYEIAVTAAGMLIAILLFFLVIALCLTDAEAETMWVNVGEHSHLNGRSRAVDGEIVAKLQRGWEVEVVHIRNGWALIDGYGEGGHCWVSAKYLTDEKPGEVRTIEPVKVRTTVSRLLVRSCPGGSVVGRIDKKGTKLTVLATVIQSNVKWAYLGNGRWVMWRYLEGAK